MLSAESKAELIAYYDQNHSLKLVAWHLGKDNPHLLADSISN